MILFLFSFFTLSSPPQPPTLLDNCYQAVLAVCLHTNSRIFFLLSFLSLSLFHNIIISNTNKHKHNYSFPFSFFYVPVPFITLIDDHTVHYYYCHTTTTSFTTSGWWSFFGVFNVDDFLLLPFLCILMMFSFNSLLPWLHLIHFILPFSSKTDIIREPNFGQTFFILLLLLLNLISFFWL